MAVMSSHKLEGSVLDKLQAKMTSEVEQKVNGVNGHHTPNSPQTIVADNPESAADALLSAKDGPTASEKSADKNLDAVSCNQELPEHRIEMSANQPEANGSSPAKSPAKHNPETIAEPPPQPKTEPQIDSSARPSPTDNPPLPNLKAPKEEANAASADESQKNGTDNADTINLGQKAIDGAEATTDTTMPDTIDTKTLGDDKLDIIMKDAHQPESQPAPIEASSSAENLHGTQSTAVTSEGPKTPLQSKTKPSADKAGVMVAPSEPAASKSPAKFSREREDDTTEPPAPKRVRTEPPSPASKKSKSDEKSEPAQGDAVPAPAEDVEMSGVSAPTKPVPQKVDDLSEYDDIERDDAPLTAAMMREAKKAISGIKKTKLGEKLFTPVWTNWPEIKENYLAMIDNPMDFGQVEATLKSEKGYASLRALKDDVKLLYTNCLQYNGPGHQITDQTRGYAVRVMDSIKTAINEKPRPPRHSAKATPATKRHAEPRTVQKPARRESVATPVSPAVPKASGESFALAPSGVPVIRRDPSNQEDKRPIVPPKNKDLDYSGQSLKKLTPEMKFFEHLLSKLRSQEYLPLSGPFLVPVDPVALNIPTYYQIVKNPMDLSTIEEKIQTGHYKKGKDVEADFALMFRNCYKFNPAGNPVHDVGKQFEEVYKKHMGEKAAWLKKNAPAPAPAKLAKGKVRSESSDSDSEAEEPPRVVAQDDAGDVKALGQHIKILEARLLSENEGVTKEINKANPDELQIRVAQSVITALTNELITEKKKLAEAKKSQMTAKPKATKAAPHKASKSSGGASTAASRKREPQSKRPSKKKAARAPKRQEPTEAHRNVVTDGILNLDEESQHACIEIIKKDTRQTENDSGELELDVNVLSAEAVWELFDIISASLPHVARAHMKGPADEPLVSEEAERTPPRQVAKAAKPKKAKPMGKQEQEAKIEQLKNLRAQFQRQGSSGSQEPLPSVEDSHQQQHSSQQADFTSDDESADSEEE